MISVFKIVEMLCFKFFDVSFMINTIHLLPIIIDESHHIPNTIPFHSFKHEQTNTNTRQYIHEWTNTNHSAWYLELQMVVTAPWHLALVPITQRLKLRKFLKNQFLGLTSRLRSYNVQVSCAIKKSFTSFNSFMWELAVASAYLQNGIQMLASEKINE
jgi:hypothetical protein